MFFCVTADGKLETNALWVEAAASTTVNNRKEIKRERSSLSILQVIELRNISIVVRGSHS